MTTGRTHRAMRRAAQGGSILLPAAAAIVVGLVLLGATQLGYYYHVKREAQKAADMAALAGAQRIEVGDSAGPCPGRIAATVAEVAWMNQPAGQAPAEVDVRCGEWSPADGPHPLPAGVAEGDAAQAAWYFDDTAGATLNAVWAEVRREVPRLVPGVAIPASVGAHAVAVQQTPLAAFGVGSQLARFRADTVLGTVLRQVGIDPAVLTVLDGLGLANLTVEASGLLAALGVELTADMTVADVNRLLAAREVSIAQVLDATAALVGREQVADLGLDLLRGLPVPGARAGLTLDELRLPLGSVEDTRGLLAEIVGGGQNAAGALAVALPLADLLGAALMIAATDERQVQPDLLDAGLRRAYGAIVDVPGLPGVHAETRVVEPARIAVGGIGATAYNAQVRTFVEVDTDRIPLIGPLLRSLDTRVHLPLYLDVVGGHGTLTDMACQESPRRAEVTVASSLLRLCVGAVDPAQRFSQLDVCAPPALSATPLVRLLGRDMAATTLVIDGLAAEPQKLAFAVGEDSPLPLAQSTSANPLRLGTTFAELGEALGQTIAQLYAPRDRPVATVAADLATQYLEASKVNGRYDVAAVIPLLRDGGIAADGSALQGLGTWDVPDGVPHVCPWGLGLVTCWRDGPVWDGFRRTVTGEGRGLVSGLLGTLLGGLVLEDCAGLASQLVGYNRCVRENLASYLQTSPDDLAGGGTPAEGRCTTVLCRLLGGVTAALRPLLDDVGGVLGRVLADVAGIELGRTDVSLHGLACHRTRLVY